jgi:iron complex outermembrane receptor protein
MKASLLSCLVAALVLPHVFAQSPASTNAAPAPLPPVTVIGEKPALPQPETVSASVVAGDLFERGGFANTRDLTAIAPNTSLFDGNNPRTPRFSVRGFRENNFLIGEPAVALYVDDVPFLDLASRGLPLYGIEQAEFLRGPQGTLYGFSGIAGVMNLRTAPPANAWHGQLNAGFGSYAEQSYQLGVSGPLAPDRLALSLSGFYGTQDGFVRNEVTGSRADDRETLSGRAALRWTPNELWDITLTLAGDRFRDDFIPTYYPTTLFPGAVADTGPFRVKRNIDGYNDTDAFSQALRVGYTAESFKVVSVTTHRDWKQDLLQDFDFTALALRNGFARPDVETWSQEIRVQSPDETERLRWLGGAFFADTTIGTDSGSEEFSPIELPPGSGFVLGPPTTFRTRATTEGQTYALFGQATYSVSERLDLVGGLRLNHDRRDIRRSRTISSPSSTFFGFPAGPFSTVTGAYTADADDTRLLPKVGATWHFSKRTLGYASFSGGHQSGGFNASNDSAAQSRFDPAFSWNYELGLKTETADARYAANVAVFYTDAHDYHVYRLNAFDPTAAYLQNAARAAIYGAELELTARPLDGLELTGGIGYTHAEYDRYFDAVNGASLDGRTISFVPEWTANLAAQYRFGCGIYLRLEGHVVGDYYLTEDNQYRQPAFCLLNARVGYETARWGVYVFGRNLLDKEYTANALDLRYALQPDQVVRMPGNPAVFGVGFTARF